MAEQPKPDFSGWATKANLMCSDGRTILPDAFKHQDQVTVPLVWQHNHSSPENVLGHAVLEHREEGVYAYGFFNDTAQAETARSLVTHRDITSLSIYANQLTEKAKKVVHGVIREISLVLSGANPGALIDNVTLAHSDGSMAILDDEAIIYTGEELERSEESDNSKDSEIEHAENEDDGPTVQEVYNGMTDEQKEVVHYMVGTALEGGSIGHSSDETKPDEKSGKDQEELEHGEGSAEKERDGRRMSRNVFEQEQTGESGGAPARTLSHSDLRGIVEEAQQLGSLKEAFEGYALKHGIDDIELLFPDAKNITQTPEFDARRMEWVRSVLSGTNKTPFSRIKSLVADLTFEAARAKGYIKGNFKKEEFFGLAKRVTTPTTIYKKQKLDRDDIVDITDFDVVVWLKGEMRLMLDEEIARAVLIGDGREVDDEDKIRDPAGSTEGAGVRSIVNEHDLYAASIYVNIDDASSTPTELVDAVLNGMQHYKGSGSPTFYTTLPTLTWIMLERDQFGHRLWKTKSELANELNVADIVTVEVMEDEADLVGIIVNLRDYTIGADRGGEINFFDDFDIDYNQYKYLYETRISGALTKIRSAVIVRKVESTAVLVVPVEPAFDEETFEVTVATTAGITYKNKVTGSTLTTGTPVTIAAGASLTVIAVPNSGYYFESNQDDEWTYSRPAA